ncbi:MAG: ribosome-associated translation inhibitor RaiA [Methylotenera sp.]|uniref:ribosome hibernation-promoting factor, HPF/YfiA family n=1 Tax=Methylotenera sp. TaxID=2051956 RepID=UPI00271F00BF|nr:ribosome-associated translation inhibitor RaiA [Methylotenera sp.]MDO9392748.1 ribosome-associated translation inhibitor RaiA [Methylotenera sp.]MDP1521992.1 ribosome-associated translation inhibitor RaiA [Methylotenera sp.]MDP2230366.1 ribosome-associated translation inhibitor RaiA [Methylotenera sp.]MDP3141176.1 ribosome-associated translation inhibitor RaiA [Methylotenera sp.]MDP3819187.1 ribosome-associated translation inhibitor RaiA [Methylotenera sp.]
MMQLDIQTNGFSITEGIRHYTTQRMQFALDRNDGQIIHARVSLADINGPRGGIDKRCQINLALVGQNNIVIEDTEADLYVAIDRASGRCERTLVRRLERLRQHSHDSATIKLADEE